MLPDFLIIGAHKAGTTSLHHYFDQHPNIFMTVVKEPNYFSFDPLNGEHIGEASSQFRVRSLAEYQNLFNTALLDSKRGEASPSYLFSSLAPNRIRQILPDCKLIVSLRNPVDRTYSAYQMALRSGRTKMKLSELVPERDPWFQGGLYSRPLQTYLDVFGLNAVKVILFDDLSRTPQAVMRELFEYVNVNSTFEVDASYRFNPGGIPSRPVLHYLLNSLKKIPGLQQYAPTRLRNKLRVLRDNNLKKADQLNVDVKEYWLRYFRSDILKTQDLVKQDLSGWLSAS